MDICVYLCVFVFLWTCDTLSVVDKVPFQFKIRININYAQNPRMCSLIGVNCVDFVEPNIPENISSKNQMRQWHKRAAKGVSKV